MTRVPYNNLPPADQAAAETEIAGLIADRQDASTILYSVLRRFRPDLFEDDPDRGKLTLLISGNDDRYYRVSIDVLRRSLDIPAAERLRWLRDADVCDGVKVTRLTPTTIYSDNDVDLSFVDDSDGWADYEDQVADIVANG